MRRNLAADGDDDTLGDDILDELEGEALVILEHPDQHAAVTVNMARKTLAMIRRMRGNGNPCAAPQVA